MKNKQNIILLIAAGLLLTTAAVNLYLSQAQKTETPTSRIPIDNRDKSATGMTDQGSLDGESMPANHDALMKIKSLSGELEKNPNDRERLIQLGNLLYDNGDFLGAIKPYEKALDLDPANTNVRNDYAVCFFNTGNPEKAVKELEKVTAADPNNISALYNLGVVHAHSGRKDLATKYWNMVVARQPNSDMGQKAEQGLAKMN